MRDKKSRPGFDPDLKKKNKLKIKVSHKGAKNQAAPRKTGLNAKDQGILSYINFNLAAIF